jgi:SseB protein N-terminal domain
MTIVTDDSSTAGEHAQEVVERALAAAIADSSRIGDLLDELSRGRLWLPLPDDGEPVTDGSAVNLPTVTYLGCEFVPAFTSAARLRASVPQPRSPGMTMPVDAGGPPSVAPHIVVPAAALARRLPPDVGIALNPGAGESVPVYPEGVAYLAAAQHAHPSSRIRVGPLPFQPDALLAGIRSGLQELPAVTAAAAAWLSVEFAGEGLVISVTLDDPADGTAQRAAIQAVERAALATPQDSSFPIDVTFPGEGEPDPVDQWIAASAIPFYVRG